MTVLIAKADEDIWVSSAGLAELESGQPLAPCHIMPVGDISQLFCAAACMLMIEDGILNLESKIQNFLPDDYVMNIPNSKTATIAQLLSHTSGIPDYSDNSDFSLEMLNNKNMDFNREIILEKYLMGQAAKFSPGTEYGYSASNYELLTLIMDQVYSKGHASFYSFRLIRRLGLNRSFYKNETDYFSLHSNSMANGYYDRMSDGKLENATDLSISMASGQTGSHGVVSNVVDLYMFLKALMEAELISESSLDLMKDYTKEPENLSNIKYGLGLEFRQHDIYGTAIGHGGRSSGFTSEAWYYPEQNAYLIYCINAGTITNGPVKRLIDEDFREAILSKLFN